MTTETVRAVARALKLLEALNVHGTTSIESLQQATDLPKTTVIRLLQSLRQSGYIRYVSRRSGYTLTPRVLRLSAGFSYSEVAVALSLKRLDDFTKRYKWPIGIATFNRGALRLQYGTYDKSPIATNVPRLDRSLPWLTTAHGQAYLAFCPPDIQTFIIQSMKARSRSRVDERQVSKLIQSVRSKGFSLRPATPSDRAMGFAVPVLYQDGVAATIGMRFFRSSISSEEAVRLYLKPLKSIATAISGDLAE